MAKDQTIRVTGGAVEYTWPTTINATDGDDISGDTIEFSLGTSAEPGTWKAPDKLTRPTPSSAIGQILVGSETDPGTYYVWVKITDTPEVVPRRGARIHVA